MTKFIRLEVRRGGFDRTMRIELLTAGAILLLAFLARAFASQL